MDSAPSSPFTLAFAGLALLVATAAWGQAPVPVGAEFQINAYTSNAQYLPAVGMDADGDFVVAWASREDGSEYGVFARRFNASGVAQATPFQVNTYTPNYQEAPSIDLDSDGDFVIAWQSSLQDGSSVRHLRAPLQLHRRSADRGAAGQLDDRRPPVVARRGADAEGDFVVAWQSNLQDGGLLGIFARRFSSAGNPLGGEFRANSFTPNSQRFPAIDVDADGDFVVAWVSFLQDGSENGIFGQRFSSAGAALGPEFQINVTFTGDQSNPRVALDSDGDFVVVWQDEIGPLEYDVRGRRFNSSGTPQGGEFQLSADPGIGDQLVPRVAADADGDFVVAWHGEGAGGENAVFVRRFKAGGGPQHLDTEVESSTNPVAFAAVATDPDGDFVVTWNAIDGSSFGVFGQRFDVAPGIDVDGDGQFLPLTDGLLILRFAFGFTGNTLITGAVGPGCTRCDAPSITAYLNALL